MKRLIAVALMTIAAVAWGKDQKAREESAVRDGQGVSSTYSVTLLDTDIDASWELLAEVNTTFTQLTSFVPLSIINASAGSTWVTVRGLVLDNAAADSAAAAAISARS